MKWYLFYSLIFIKDHNRKDTYVTFLKSILLTVPVESTVVLQEHLNKWYSLTMYCASKIIVDLPIQVNRLFLLFLKHDRLVVALFIYKWLHSLYLLFQLLCATVFIFPAWYLTSQPMELDRMALAWIICALTTILAQTFGLVIGASCGVKVMFEPVLFTRRIIID